VNVNEEAYGQEYFGGADVEKDGAELRWFVDRVAALPPGLAIDIGCGTGGLVRAVGVSGRSAVGVDISHWALEQLDGRPVRAVADRGLPFSSGCAQVVTALDVVEHLRSPVAFLEEVRRTLKPDGCLLLSTPNAGSIIRRLQSQQWYGLQDPTHLYLFDTFSMTTLIERSGFEVVDVIRRSGAGSPLVRQLLTRTGQGGQLVVSARPA